MGRHGDKRSLIGCVSIRIPLILIIITFVGGAWGRSWRKGETVPLQCLNRTIESGEHITDPDGNLQYIPFEICTETSKPLAFTYGSSAPINCTITLTDPLYHLLEFYVHNDAPLTCRVPSEPSGAAEHAISGSDKTGALGSESTSYTPLVMALSGTLQLSHVHVANVLNLAIHTESLAGKSKKAASSTSSNKITTASAYSIDPVNLNQRLIVGSELTLTIRPSWYIGTPLPASYSTSHATPFTLFIYMLLAATASAVVCTVYFRGIDLPRRLRFHGQARLGGQGAARYDQLPTSYKGYGGYGHENGGRATPVGNGYGLSFGGTTGKRD